MRLLRLTRTDSRLQAATEWHPDILKLIRDPARSESLIHQSQMQISICKDILRLALNSADLRCSIQHSYEDWILAGDESAN